MILSIGDSCLSSSPRAPGENKRELGRAAKYDGTNHCADPFIPKLTKKAANTSCCFSFIIIFDFRLAILDFRILVFKNSIKRPHRHGLSDLIFRFSILDFGISSFGFLPEFLLSSILDFRNGYSEIEI